MRSFSRVDCGASAASTKGTRGTPRTTTLPLTDHPSTPTPISHTHTHTTPSHDTDTNPTPLPRLHTPLHSTNRSLHTMMAAANLAAAVAFTACIAVGTAAPVSLATTFKLAPDGVCAEAPNNDDSGNEICHRFVDAQGRQCECPGLDPNPGEHHCDHDCRPGQAPVVTAPGTATSCTPTNFGPVPGFYESGNRKYVAIESSQHASQASNEDLISAAACLTSRTSCEYTTGAYGLRLAGSQQNPAYQDNDQAHTCLNDLTGTTNFYQRTANGYTYIFATSDSAMRSLNTAAAATAWSFDTACSTGSSTCTTKHVKKHCYNQRLGTAKYASWAIAKAACAANSNCFGVYDAGCRKSSIYLCDSRKITSSAKLSNSGSSCVFEKPNAGSVVAAPKYSMTQPGATTCPAGTAAVTNKDECDRAATLLATQKQGRTIQSGNWHWVPKYCTLQTGNGGSINGDWAAHFNTHASPSASDKSRYSMVCRVTQAAASCNRGAQWIDGAQYSQTVLCNTGGCGMSWASIEAECVAKDKGNGVFYQKHPNGHVICGVYTSRTPSTKASARWFSIAGVCGV